MKTYPISLKLKIIIISLFSFQTLYGQMNGSYTIGGTNPNFNTIQEACDSLMNQGVTGPITLNIRDGIYNESVILNTVNGVSTINTVTFQSESLDSSLVTVQSASGREFRFSTNYVILNALTINNSSAGSFNNIRLDGVSNLTINQCSLNNIVGSAMCLIHQGGGNVENINITSSSFVSTGPTMQMNVNRINNFNLISSSLVVTGTTGVGAVGLFTSNMSNVTIDNSYLHMSSGDAINLEASSDSLFNIRITNTVIDTARRGILLQAETYGDSISIDGLTLRAEDYGLFYTSPSGNISNTEMLNSNIRSNLNASLHIESEGFNTNTVFLNDTLVSTSNQSLYIQSNNGSINDVMINQLMAVADTFGGGGPFEAGVHINSVDSNVSNVSIDQSNIYGAIGIYIYASDSLQNFSLDNSVVNGNNYIEGQGVYLESDSLIQGTSIHNSQINGNGDRGYGFYALSQGTMNNLILQNSNVSGDDYALNLSITEGTRNLSLTSSSFTTDNNSSAGSMGIRIFNEANTVNNITIDSCTVISGKHGIYFQTNNPLTDSITNLNITNSQFTIQTLAFGPGAHNGIALENNNAFIDSVTIYNNQFTFNNTTPQRIRGIILSSALANNITVDNNNMAFEGGLNSYGISVIGAGENVTVSNNVIDSVSSESHYYTGIATTGSSMGISDILIQNNRVVNAHRGIIVSNNIDSLSVDGNTIHNYYTTPSTITPLPTTGIESFNITTNGRFEIKNNQLICKNDNRAIELGFYGPLNFSTTNKARIYNNFCINYTVSVVLNDCQNIVIANNSLRTDKNLNSLIEINNPSTGVELLNNLIQVDTSIFSYPIYYMQLDTSNNIPVTAMDHNYYNLDTTQANFVYIQGISAIYNSLNLWQSIYGLGLNSGYHHASYVNDSLDLHLQCVDTLLNVGLPIPYITTDIDGEPRAAIPMVGADEITKPIANFTETTNGLQVSFTNTSLNANSYWWNFGDGDTSTTANPTHMYSSPGGVFTVTLVAIGQCNNDTVQFTVNPNTVGINENYANNRVTIFPNPADAFFYLQIVNDIELQQLDIYTTTGQLIQTMPLLSSKNQVRIDIASLPKGIYFVQLTDENQSYTHKLIKQ